MTRERAQDYGVYDVFTPTSQATLNFVERPAVNDQLVDGLRTPGKQLIIYGETGSGKSTLLQNKLSQVYEGQVTTQCHASMTFGQVVLDAFDQLAPYYLDNAKRVESGTRGASLSADFVAIKASVDQSMKRLSEDDLKRVLPPQLTVQRLGQFLGEQNLCWVIEDFHKVEESEKTQLAQALKVFCDLATEYRHVKVIAVGATDTARQVVAYDPEMAHRVAEVHVPLMTDEEIGAILQGGEELLNIEFGAAYDLIGAYSVGVASICHQLALNCCLRRHVHGRVSGTPTKLEASDLAEALQMYIRDSSDTLKARFEQALRRQQVKRYDNARLILRALSTGPQHGMLHGEIMNEISKVEPSYPAGNLTNYLRRLQSPELGAIIRVDGGGRYSFVDPFHQLYAHLTLGRSASDRPALSDDALAAALSVEMDSVLSTLLEAQKSLMKSKYYRSPNQRAVWFRRLWFEGDQPQLPGFEDVSSPL